MNHVQDTEGQLVDLKQRLHAFRLLADALNNRIRELEAQAAAMREVLETLVVLVDGRVDFSAWDPDQIQNAVERIRAALAPAAGRELLERLERTETDRDKYHAAVKSGDQPCKSIMDSLTSDLAAARARIAELQAKREQADIEMHDVGQQRRSVEEGFIAARWLLNRMPRVEVEDPEDFEAWERVATAVRALKEWNRDA